MAGFPLAGLEPALLEKILTKLDSKSYFRIRQACREIDEFIRKSRNISVHLGEVLGTFDLKFDEDEPDQLCIFSSRFIDTWKNDIEAFYGIRFSWITLPDEGFDQLCKVLKTYRITCEHLCMFNSTYSKEECVTLLNILNPTSALMGSQDSNRYEALLQSKILKKAEVWFDDQFEAKTVLPKFLSKFSDLSMSVFSIPVHNDMILAVLQIICHHPQPKLRDFRLFAYGNADFNEIVPKLIEIGMKIDMNHIFPRIWMDMPNGFVCRVTVFDYGIYIYYDTVGYEDERDSLDNYDEDQPFRPPYGGSSAGRPLRGLGSPRLRIFVRLRRTVVRSARHSPSARAGPRFPCPPFPSPQLLPAAKILQFFLQGR